MFPKTPSAFRLTVGNHSISLPIILKTNKIGQMLPYSYLSSLLVSFYVIAFNFFFQWTYGFIFGLKWSFFVLNI